MRYICIYNINRMLINKQMVLEKPGHTCSTMANLDKGFYQIIVETPDGSIVSHEKLRSINAALGKAKTF